MKGNRPNIAALNAVQVLEQLQAHNYHSAKTLATRQIANALPDPYKQVLAVVADRLTTSVDVMTVLQCEQNYAGMLLNELYTMGLLVRTSRIENGSRCYVYTLAQAGKLVTEAINEAANHA